ncbi:MAG: FliH/SctL family protein [Cellulosilyticaceae bacterium]
MSNIIKGHRISGEKSIEIGKQLVVPIIHEKADETQQVQQQVQQQMLEEAARKESAQLLEEAKRQVNKMLSEADQELKERERLLKVQIDLLEEEAQFKVKQLEASAAEKAKALIAQAQVEKEEIISQAEPEIIALVQQLVGHIIHEELSEHTEWIGLLVRKIRHHEMMREPITLSMNPVLYERLSEAEKHTLMAMGEGVKLRTDENLYETMCEIETSQGSISYDIEEGLGRVLKELGMLQSL